MIESKRTYQSGVVFRSRLEARYAVFFDALELKWEYEKHSFFFDGTGYLPDFYFPDFDCFVEIKPGRDVDLSKPSGLAKLGKRVAVMCYEPASRGCWSNSLTAGFFGGKTQGKELVWLPLARFGVCTGCKKVELCLAVGKYGEALCDCRNIVVTETAPDRRPTDGDDYRWPATFRLLNAHVKAAQPSYLFEDE